MTAGLGVILGIGLDIVDLEKFERLYGADDPEILARCFDQSELEAIEPGVNRSERLAARLAAKEATFKALGGASGIAHTDIIVISDARGAPNITLTGAAKALADSVGAQHFLVSLSHSDSIAAAVVVAIAGPR